MMFRPYRNTSKCYFQSLGNYNNGDLFTLENKMLFSRVKNKLFSRVKILCLLAKAQLVFQWCLCNKDMLFSKLESGMINYT